MYFSTRQLSIYITIFQFLHNYSRWNNKFRLVPSQLKSAFVFRFRFAFCCCCDFIRVTKKWIDYTLFGLAWSEMGEAQFASQELLACATPLATRNMSSAVCACARFEKCITLIRAPIYRVSRCNNNNRERVSVRKHVHLLNRSHKKSFLNRPARRVSTSLCMNVWVLRVRVDVNVDRSSEEYPWIFSYFSIFKTKYETRPIRLFLR